MSSYSINRVTLLGNMTRDPELKTLPSGQTVCSVRMAVNERVKNRDTEEWVDRPSYFDVTIWGRIGEVVSQQCSKGSLLLVEGKLRWREWAAQDGTKRQAVDVVADKAIPMARPPRDSAPPPATGPRPDDEGGPWTPAGTPGIDDDIPF